MPDDPRKTIVICCTWESYHVVDVPEGFQLSGDPSEWPADVQAQVTSAAAEMTDFWTVRKPDLPEPDFP